MAPADPSGTRAYRAALETLAEGLACFSAEERLVFCNAAFGRMNPELKGVLDPGQSWSVILSEARRAGLAAGLEQLDMHLDSGAAGDVSADVQRPGGAHFRLRLAPSGDGGFVITQQDVSDRYAAEELRAEADDLLRHVLDACGINILMCRVGTGEILYRNPAWTELFGAPATAKALYADPGRRSDFLTELLAAGQVDAFEVDLLRADGSPFPGHVTARLIEYGGERVIVSSTTDLTVLNAQRDALARQRETTFQSEKLTAMGEMLAGIAHELNNPLSIVVGQALMLRDDTEAPQILRRIDKLESAAQRCTRIVHSFLSIARQKPAQMTPVALNGIVLAAVDGLDLPDSVVPDMDLAPDLPLLLGDADQLTQVVANLVTNAVEAGGGAPQVTVTTGLAGDGSLQLAVSDSGPGIPADLRGRVFEPLFTTKDQGSGIGLALCHRIVLGHGGGIEATAAPGGGARMEVRLPVADPASGGGAPVLVMAGADNSLTRRLLRSIGARQDTMADVGAVQVLLDQGVQPQAILCPIDALDALPLLRLLRSDHPALATRVILIGTRAPGVEDFGLPVLEPPMTLSALGRVLAGVQNRSRSEAGS